MDVINWLLDPANWTGAEGIPTRLFEHLAICAVSVATATAIGLPVGLYIGHTGRFAGLAINLANIGRALPSYAILAMILPLSLDAAPILGYDPAIGLTLIPVFVAMTLLAIPPILVNAYAGLQSVDRDLIEASRGMGMTESGILRRVELPIAMPIVVGGIRTATLQVIATATIGAIVSFGGLGRYIIDGLLRSEEGMLIAGAILVTALAIGIDLLLAQVQRWLTPKALRDSGDQSLTRTSVGGVGEPSTTAV